MSNKNCLIKQRQIVKLSAAIAMISLASYDVAAAQLEEITVTARKAQESLQDVPVTVSAISANTIDRFQIDDPAEIANMVPNLTIQKGGSGSGGMVRLRGVGNSNISAAFDTAVSFNIDGLQINNARYLYQGMFDMEQIEVLKGPQSLYFGKSSSAGVLTMRSKNPGDEFEAGVTASYEFEEDGTKYEAFVSGPITETLGARLAVRWTDIDEIVKNTAGPANIGGIPAGTTPMPGDTFFGPGSTTPENKWRGEEEKDARLTLVWEPNEKFSANMKVLVSKYENDGEIFMTDIGCADGNTPQPDSYFGGTVLVPVDLDCDPTDAEIQIGDNLEIQSYSSPKGGVPFYEADTTSVALTMDYDLTDNLSLTSVTGYIELETAAQDNYAYTNNGGPSAYNAKSTRENFSQEFRIASDFAGTFDFSAGIYYQTRDIIFDTHQAGAGNAAIFAGPDPVTGLTVDYSKIHETTADALSYYVNFIFRPIDTVEVNFGVRQNHEEHDGDVTIPYMHAALEAFGVFFPTGTTIKGIKFEDDDLTPEASVMWRVRPNISLFAAYKTGFKSGGIDNSLLPLGDPSNQAFFAQLLPFGSETVSGFEVGMKSDLLDNTLRFNVTAYKYVYEDLQLQEFDPIAFNFTTLNAGEVTTQGVEFDLLWATPVEGLTLMAALAYTDAEYTDDFFVNGVTNLVEVSPGTFKQNQKGSQVQGSSEWAGNFGLNYEMSLTDALVMNFGVFTNYRSEYQTGLFLDSYEQDAYWKTDANISLGSADGKWEVALIGSNLGDEVTINAMPSFRPAGARNAQGFGDEQLNFSHGRLITLQGKWNF